MKDTSHGYSDGVVVCVDRFWSVGSARRSEFLSGGEQRFDNFVSENDQRGHGPQTGRQRLVAAGLTDAADDVFGTEFLEIIGGVVAGINPRFFDGTSFQGSTEYRSCTNKGPCAAPC